MAANVEKHGKAHHGHNGDYENYDNYGDGEDGNDSPGVVSDDQTPPTQGDD